jgi:hypothetical protein
VRAQQHRERDLGRVRQAREPFDRRYGCDRTEARGRRDIEELGFRELVLERFADEREAPKLDRLVFELSREAIDRGGQ